MAWILLRLSNYQQVALATADRNIHSQREPGSWKAMIMNDEVSANAIMKRATKHYIVVIQPIENL